MIIRKRDGFFGERYLLLPIKSYPELMNNELVHGNYITEIGYYPNALYHYAERTQGAPENILIYCVDGSGTIELEHLGRLSLKKGDVFSIPSQVPHRYFADSENPWSIMWFHYSSTVWDEFPAVLKDRVIHLSVERQRRLQNHFVDLFTLVDQHISLGNLICASNFLCLILAEAYYMDDTTGRKDKQRVHLNKCINYMNQNLDKNLSLDNLAKYVGVSISYLNKIFNTYTQKSPIDYFIEMKIDEACKYIALSDLKVGEVAESLGYQDQFYFSKLFKKKIGKSPQAFRKSTTHLRKGTISYTSNLENKLPKGSIE